MNSFNEDEKEYVLINTYDELNEVINGIDLWKNDVYEQKKEESLDFIESVKNGKIGGPTLNYIIDKEDWNDEELILLYDEFYFDGKFNNAEDCYDIVKEKLNDKTYEESYFDEHSLLIVEFVGSEGTTEELSDVCINGKDLNVNIEYETRGVFPQSTATLFFISLHKNDIEKVENINVNSYEKENIFLDPSIAYKPIIYLYPKVETRVEVLLGNSEKITCSYPKYNDGWNVIAKPNGDLKQESTGKNLYALYYESENIYEYKVEKEGFVIKGEESAEFLEEKLKILGLSDREAQEFIIYWLPKLEANKYNYIRFASIDEINLNMPLEINPAPDTLMRVLMTYKGLEEPIEVDEQQLVLAERTGYVAVEWGGTEIK